MDFVALRAEIKSWERDFKSEHGRDPQIQDIKDRPNIAEKYKLYKKLSKAKPSASADPPSTPPKPKSIISKSRAIKTATPSISNNPFSPVKNAGKHKHTEPVGPTRVVSNPFATPAKAVKSPREPSPDPFPLIQSSQIASSSQFDLPPPPNSAISRARKRLRGEPVSPSPVKIKRQRVTSQISLQLTQNIGGTFCSDDDSDTEDAAEANSSFIVDSPVKVPAGSKSFMSLFNENPNPRSNKPNGLKRTLSRPTTATALFDRAGSVLSDDEMHINGLLVTQVNTTRSKKAQNEKLSLPQGSIPGRDRLRCNGHPLKERKRSLSDAEMEDASSNVQSHGPLLLPPSPPPVSSYRDNNRYDLKGKGKASGTNNRKKPKTSVITNDDENEDSQGDEKVKIVDWRRDRRISGKEGMIWQDEEPRLGHRKPSPDEAIPGSNGELIVNVPQELLHVLSISPTRSGCHQERRVVRALLHGTRVDHYDGNRGGHIFHVGETVGDEDGQADEWGGVDEAMKGRIVVSEGEDDEWEGEGVAWNTAEL